MSNGNMLTNDSSLASLAKLQSIVNNATFDFAQKDSSVPESVLLHNLELQLKICQQYYLKRQFVQCEGSVLALLECASTFGPRYGWIKEQISRECASRNAKKRKWDLSLVSSDWKQILEQAVQLLESVHTFLGQDQRAMWDRKRLELLQKESLF
jgi:hypothetical protein